MNEIERERRTHRTHDMDARISICSILVETSGFEQTLTGLLLWVSGVADPCPPESWGPHARGVAIACNKRGPGEDKTASVRFNHIMEICLTQYEDLQAMPMPNVNNLGHEKANHYS